jgi:hypothetical protein
VGACPRALGTSRTRVASQPLMRPGDVAAPVRLQAHSLLESCLQRVCTAAAATQSHGKSPPELPATLDLPLPGGINRLRPLLLPLYQHFSLERVLQLLHVRLGTACVRARTFRFGCCANTMVVSEGQSERAVCFARGF